MKRAAALLVAVAAGCATAPEPGVPDVSVPEISERRENVAVAGLMESARADTEAGRLSTAAASLERALRIEPRNPRLWHELARVRLRQGELAQAESMAARSNAWAGSDSALRAENQKVIEAAREAARR